ncbi:MAG: ParB N-terminal domain-containing protein [Candidatus Kerfeldbacteria bacterium]|nr:ParB N-terminal domain-containing protein [Candidatus Kerfeldbacteria bacterium]
MNSLFAEIPIEQIQEDPNQPRENFGSEDDDNPLLVSMKTLGTGNAVLVQKVDEQKYTIMDGHRRYRFAKKIGQKTIWCHVYAQLHKGDFALMRYHFQNVRRGWKPLERAEALVQIQEARKLKTYKEVGDCVNLSESTVRQAMDLRHLKLEHLSLMEKYGLSSAYRNEFVRLKPKMRKIQDIEVGDIIVNLFDRVQRKIIKSSKEFRILGSIFNRASANEQEIYRYLKNQEMTVADLERRCSTSGFSLLIEKMLQQLAGKRSAGVPLSDHEEKALQELYRILKLYR